MGLGWWGYMQRHKMVDRGPSSKPRELCMGPSAISETANEDVDASNTWNCLFWSVDADRRVHMHTPFNGTLRE